MPPGDYTWLVGFALANMVLRRLVPAAVRRRFGDEAAGISETCAGGMWFGAFAVWLAVFWGFIYAAVFLGLGLVLAAPAVVRYRRRRVNVAKPEAVDIPSETCS